MPHHANSDPNIAILFLALAVVCALVFPVFHRRRLIRAVECGQACSELRFSTHLDAEEIFRRLSAGAPDSLLICQIRHNRLTFRIDSGSRRALPLRRYDYSIEVFPGSIFLRRLPDSRTLSLPALKQFLNQTLR